VEDTQYGMRLIARRELGEGRVHVRVTNQIFPCAITIPMSNEMTITQWHVPIDDRHCYWYSMFTSFDKPVDKALMRAQRLKEHTLPDYAPIKNPTNRYGYDPVEQRSSTYTGMGSDINVHDQWAVESMGAIADRRIEHLASSDIGIVRFRKQLSRAIARLDSPIQDPERAPGALNGDAAKGPIAVDAIAQSQDWEQAWRARDTERRRTCPWDATL
jgi:phthalate 4,5-dioxygenase oxygenase subunit